MATPSQLDAAGTDFEERFAVAVTPAVASARKSNGNDSDSNSDSDDDIDPNNPRVCDDKSDTETPLLSPQRKGRSAETQARAQNKQKARQPPVKKSSRVKAKRSHIYHLLPPNLQCYLPRTHPNYYNYYGTVVCKTLGSKI